MVSGDRLTTPASNGTKQSQTKCTHDNRRSFGMQVYSSGDARVDNILLREEEEEETLATPRLHRPATGRETTRGGEGCVSRH
jgi:hypothetical protein